MKNVFKSYLFEKHILVCENVDDPAGNSFETLFALANLFGIRITEGGNLARPYMIRYAAAQLGEKIPEPFYKGFPQSVRALSPNQLFFDQMLHYVSTYGLNNFDNPGHSVFEESFERTAFNEKVEIKDFTIVTTDEAAAILAENVDNLLSGTRPLKDSQYQMVEAFLSAYDHRISRIASKNTAIRLLLDTRDKRFLEFISLSDVIKLVDELNYTVYHNDNIGKLNLRNQDRKFISSVIDTLIDAGKCNLRTCYEKKKAWKGLLHHIHYAARTDEGRRFVNAMRGDGNESVYSGFEAAMADKNIREAVDVLKKGKGSGAVLRNINYLISRSETLEEVDYVLACMETKNVIVLLQLLLEYSFYDAGTSRRTFKFVKHNKLRVHAETAREAEKRRSVITEAQAGTLAGLIRSILTCVLKNRLGKVYIDPAMKSYALPIQESATQGGFGVLPRGSRIHIENGRKLRAFTYWEKVNDIDLSVFALDSKGGTTEFSWRTQAVRQSGAITFSGDQTAGYNGGSEYFDINTEKFLKRYPEKRYLIFCNNVYSGLTFSQCVCRAGYMIRNIWDTGLVFEPKTVKSSFTINADSRMAYLFGLDLKTNDFIWLNMARDSSANVAGTTDMRFLMKYFHVTDVINIGSFFEMMASEIVDDPALASVVVTNKSIDPDLLAEGTQVIREYDFDKIIAYMDQEVL